MSVSEFIINESDPWWNPNWIYRRYLSFTAPPTGILAGHPMRVEMSKALLKASKIRSDFKDIRVVQLNDVVPKTWTELDRTVTDAGTHYDVRFELQEDVAADTTEAGRYYIYYGNKNLTGASLPDPYAWSSYPLEVNYNHPGITYTRLGEHWIDGVSSTRNARGSFRFWGERIRLYSAKGPDQGILEVRVDSDDWQDADLFNYQLSSGEIVYEIDNLADTKHILHFRVSGRKNPSSTSTECNVEKVAYSKFGLCENVREEVNNRLFWSTGTGGKT